MRHGAMVADEGDNAYGKERMQISDLPA